MILPHVMIRIFVDHFDKIKIQHKRHRICSLGKEKPAEIVQLCRLYSFVIRSDDFSLFVINGFALTVYQ